MNTRRVVNVLIITEDISMVAGVGRCLLDFCRYVKRTEINPIIVGPWAGENELTIKEKLDGLDILFYHKELGYWLPSPKECGVHHFWGLVKSLRRRVWALEKLVVDHEIDVIYSNGLHIMDGAVVAAKTGRPHLWHLHESTRANADHCGYLPAFITEYLVRKWCDHIVVNSKYLSRLFPCSTHRSKVSIIHNGVETSKFSQSDFLSDQTQVRHLPQSNWNTIVSVGSVVPRKDYETLIRASAIVIAAYDNTRFFIVGANDRKYRRQLDQLITTMSLERNVVFLGERTDVEELIAEADLLVHTANQETFGRVIIEAMAEAKPVVATRCGGPEEIIKNGQTGFLVPVGDVHQIASKIISLIDNPNMAEQMGHAGRYRVEHKFSASAYATQLSELILYLANR